MPITVFIDAWVCQSRTSIEREYGRRRWESYCNRHNIRAPFEATSAEIRGEDLVLLDSHGTMVPRGWKIYYAGFKTGGLRTRAEDLVIPGLGLKGVDANHLLRSLMLDELRAGRFISDQDGALRATGAAVPTVPRCEKRDAWYAALRSLPATARNAFRIAPALITNGLVIRLLI